ncbi:MAG: hypothetical protein ACOH2F_03785 [Cellulomonas sp.]
MIMEFSGLPGVHPNFFGALLVLERHSSAEMLTRFFRVPVHAAPDEIRSDLVRIMRMSGGRSTYGYVLRGELPGTSWAFEANDPLVAAQASALQGFGSSELLGDHYDVVSASLRSTESADVPIRILTGKGISRTGRLEVETAEDGWTESSPRWRELGPVLQEGDLVLRGIHRPGDVLMVGEILREHLPLHATRHVAVLRPKSDRTRADSRFYLAYLRSSAAQVQIAARVSGIHLTGVSLTGLPLPVPDAPLREAFGDLEVAERQLAGWTGEVEQLLTEAFDRNSPTEARSHVIARGRLLRQRVEAAALLDDPSYKFATRYPQPVATRWSVAANLRGRDDDLEYIRKALDCYETLLAFTASVGVALARGRGQDVTAIAEVRSRLSRGQGPTLATWWAILQELGNAKAVKTRDQGGDLMGIGQFMVDRSATAKAGKYLADLRNDLAHGRPPVASDLSSVASEVEGSMFEVLEAASFLMDLVPVYVTEVRWDALLGQASLVVQRLAGDRTVLPFESLSYPSATVEVGSLYVADEEGALHLLRPFLMRTRCPECQNLSTFNVDGSSGSGVWLKSLEDGHRMSYPDAEPFRRVGYL